MQVETELKFQQDAPKTVFIFHRGDMFYPVELKNDWQTISANIRLNPGTIKVTNAETKEVVWSTGDAI